MNPFVCVYLLLFACRVILMMDNNNSANYIFGDLLSSFYCCFCCCCCYRCVYDRRTRETCIFDFPTQFIRRLYFLILSINSQFSIQFIYAIHTSACTRKEPALWQSMHTVPLQTQQTQRGYYLPLLLILVKFTYYLLFSTLHHRLTTNLLSIVYGIFNQSIRET